MSIMYNKKNEENIIEKYNLQNKDKIRMKIFNFLKENSLTTNQKKSIEFYKYITEDNQQNLFYTYMTILLGGYDEKLAFRLLNEILISYKKRSTIYTFKELFKINEEWYEYYNVNADIHGNLKKNESRKGVNKYYVNDVMRLKNMIENHITTNLPLENAIIIYQNIKMKKHLSET